MTATLSPFPVFRAFDANGAPLAGGKLYSYRSNTSTPLDTYVDESGITANTNPVQLDSKGQANVWLGSDYAYTLYLEHDEVRRAWDSDSKEPVLSFTRAWMLVRFFNSGQMQMSACNVCSASFVTHKHELESDFVCVMCKPPARIVGMLRKQEDYFGKF